MLSRLLCVLLLTVNTGAAEVVRAGRWELHSSFWMNLHQTLLHDAGARRSDDRAVLSGAEREAWQTAVAAYRTALRTDAPVELQDELTQVADDAMSIHVAGPLADALRQAAPVYRAHWWAADDAANRYLIGYASAMLHDAGEELVRAHETAYGEEFPASIRVDLAAYAGPFGAFSISSDYGRPVATVASRDSGNQGLHALEVILHESSHSIVGPRDGRVARAIAAASKNAGRQVPPELWHALLFGTTSELTRRALLARGVTDYEPQARELFTRAWPHYREAIETHWYAYLSGTGTLEDAIAKIVAAVQ
jgi:hypothetical protein